MLSRFDDFAIHQTPEPVAVRSTADRNFYDRYWFNGYGRDGEFYFGIGMGLYPNLGVLDCGFSVVIDGEQHAFHGSRRAPLDPSRTECGPFRLEILEPMRRIRLVLDDNETGIAAELTFTARTACVEEGRQTRHAAGRVMMDATRFAQFGTWSGEVRYAGKTLRVEDCPGTKDRSWGIRPVGAPDPGPAPAQTMPGIFFLWAPLHWDDHCTHFGTFEEADGQPWHGDAAIVPVYDSPDEIPGAEDPGTQIIRTTERRVEYVPGTRQASRAEIVFVEDSGARREITLEPLLLFRMKGIGYQHFEWGHGRWKGELEIGGESWRCDDVDPLALDNLHIQQVVRATSGDRRGIGVLEQIAIGPHAPSGFKELFDGAAD